MDDAKFLDRINFMHKYGILESAAICIIGYKQTAKNSAMVQNIMYDFLISSIKRDIK